MDIKKDTLYYILSAGLNKGYILIIFPILASFLSLSNFGTWNLIIIVSFMLAPILSINGAAGILREGSVNTSHAFTLFIKFTFITIVVSIIVIYFVLNLNNWILYSVLFGLFEAFYLLTSTFIRTIDKARYYFLLSFLKFLLIISTTLYAYLNQMTLENLLYLQLTLQYIFIFLIIVIIIYNYFLEFSFHYSVQNIILFCVILIPHGLSQWLMTSSDRLIIERILGLESVGIYSLAYNIAMILVLLNTILSLVVPTYFIKNYEIWQNKRYDTIVMRYYTYISIVIFIFIFIFYTIDKNNFQILGYYGNEIPILITIIFISIYFLGLYYFYANYLFYHRFSKVLSITTAKSALLNIFLTIIMTIIIGLYGAALSTLIAYIYYVYSIKNSVSKLVTGVTIPLHNNIFIFLLSIFTIFSFWISYEYI